VTSFNEVELYTFSFAQHLVTLVLSLVTSNNYSKAPHNSSPANKPAID
jgi:hypothetical protein